MAKAFARQTKLSNIVGRSEYITDPKRQEDVVFHSRKHQQTSWLDYAAFEKQNQKSRDQNNEGREIIISLPHQLADDHEKLEAIIDEYALNLLGKNRDFEYAVHWNEQRTNFHAHIIFSERERVTERKPKRYKRDMWFNTENNRMAKAHAEGAELRYEKGQVMKDKEGNIRYESDPFTIKDPKFKSRAFNDEIKKELKDVLNKHGFKYRLFNPKKEVPQIHVGHERSRQPETYEKMKDYNQEVDELNTFLAQTKTPPNYYKAIFNDLRYANKKDWHFAMYEKRMEYSEISYAEKQSRKIIKENKSKLEKFYKKVEKREEILIELDKVTNRKYTKWNFLRAPVDLLIKKIMENNLEELGIEKEYQKYEKAKVYGEIHPTPMHKIIAKEELKIEKIGIRKNDLAIEIGEREKYKEDYGVVVYRREVNLQIEKEKERSRQEKSQDELDRRLERLKREQQVTRKPEQTRNRSRGRSR